jgi:hypothetical protein
MIAYEDLRIKNLVKNHTHPHPLLGGEPEGWVNDAKPGISSLLFV